jgi:hypothetical protein
MLCRLLWFPKLEAWGDGSFSETPKLESSFSQVVLTLSASFFALLLLAGQAQTTTRHRPN